MNQFRATLILCSSLLPLAAEAQFTIDFNFQGGLSPSQIESFNNAKATWESYITGYQPLVTRTGITINAKGEYIDGSGGVLGTAGPTSAVSEGGYLIATAGSMTFDTDDLGDMELDGILDAVIAHELAHVLGFGTLWDENYNDLYQSGSGEYMGALGLATYQDEFDPLATFVPVELSGGAGTANGHWNENNDGIGYTGITDQYGRDMADELMTGWIGGSAENIFISNTTLGTFQDLGYAVQMTIPEPSLAILASLAFISVSFSRRRP